MLQKANFLILDEPTNHLDLDSKEILENALIDYPVTILFVSHDRYFINRLATKVFELSRAETKEYLGDYDYYLEKKNEQLELEALQENEPLKKQAAKPVETAKLSYAEEKELKKKERQKQRRIEEIEKRIAVIEEKLGENEELLCDPAIFQNHEKVQDIQTENDTLNQELESLFAEWEELSES